MTLYAGKGALKLYTFDTLVHAGITSIEYEC